MTLTMNHLSGHLRSWTTPEQRDAQIRDLSLDDYIVVEFGRGGSQLARVSEIRRGRVWIEKYSANGRRFTQSMKLNPLIFIRRASLEERKRIMRY